MSFKEVWVNKIWPGTKKIAGLCKDKLIIACKWIAEKTVFCAKKIGQFSVFAFGKCRDFCFV